MIQFPALRHPDYRRLWFGAAFNQQGMSGEHVVLGALVFQITESTGWIGAIMAVYFLPLLVFGMLCTVIAAAARAGAHVDVGTCSFALRQVEEERARRVRVAELVPG